MPNLKDFAIASHEEIDENSVERSSESRFLSSSPFYGIVYRLPIVKYIRDLKLLST